MPVDSDVQRRVLGHLPAWRSPDERERAVEHEVAAGFRSIQGFSIAELRDRLNADTGWPDAYGDVPSIEELNGLLHDYEDEGLVVDSLDGWQLSERGHAVLHEPDPEFERAPWTFVQVRSAVDLSKRLVAAGFETHSNEFNRAGGITREGVQAWVDEYGAAEHGDEDLDGLLSDAPDLTEPPSEPDGATVPGEAG